MGEALDRQRIGRSSTDSTEADPRIPGMPAGAPHVVTILLDDMGFAHLGCFGSSIRTPNIDRLAAGGLRFTNFHTTPVCSPTRAALLTGRNAHSVGFGHVTERVAGYPGYSMRLPDDSATLAAVLRGAGYATRAVGKWHLTPTYETGPQGPYDRWPLGRGFDRYYGFLGGSTDQFAPELVRDNTPLPARELPAGYHLSGDLVDEAIGQLRDLGSLAPLQPFFLYLAFGACHAPHQAPAEWIESYRGAFAHGWDVEREQVLARQIELGIFPAGTELGPPNPGVRPWAELSAEEQELYQRMMEAYAGLLSYTDAQIGRLVDELEASGRLANTIITLSSDNGASGEGGPEGSVDEGLYLNDLPQRAADALEHSADLGGPRLYNHYPWGWAQAGNTPYRWYKQFTHAGGITSGLVMHWPDGGLEAGALRRQYHHVVDVMPTLLDLTGVERPASIAGVTQAPLHGVSMRAAIEDAEAPGDRRQQHYEMWGNRGMWRDGWMAVCRLQPDAAGAPDPAPVAASLDELVWELYDHRTDPTECHDLAEERPEVLRELIDLWWASAGRYDVLPVDVRPRKERWPANPPTARGSVSGRTTFRGAGSSFERGAAPKIAGTSFRATARLTVSGQVEGALYQAGGHHGGYCWYLADDAVHLEIARSSIDSVTYRTPLAWDDGEHELVLEVDHAPGEIGAVRFLLDGEEAGRHDDVRLLKRIPIGSGRSHVGAAPAGTVSGRLPYPFAFTGELHTLSVETFGPGVATSDDDRAVLREQ